MSRPLYSDLLQELRIRIIFHENVLYDIQFQYKKPFSDKIEHM